jgi:hypothetical protein
VVSRGQVGLVNHDEIIKVISKISHILPGHVSSLPNEELTDFGLEAVDEVEAEVCGVAVGQVGDEALKLIGVGLDRSSLVEGTDVLTGLVIWVGISHVTEEGVGEGIEGVETSKFFLALRCSVAG